MHRVGTLLLILLSLAPWLAPTTQDAAADYRVEPGDTWVALAVRTGVPEAELRALSSHINTDRQPAIGATIRLPVTPADTTGRLVRLNDGGLLARAAADGLSPWQLALANGLASPYEPGLWRPVVVPGDSILRELPGTGRLALTPDSPVPGQALAAHLSLPLNEGETDMATAKPSVALDGQPWAVSVSGTEAVAVGGTGAFAGPGERELSVRVGDRPVWRQPWLVSDREWVFQQLTLTGDAAAIDQAAIEAERERLAALWSIISPAPQWTEPFRLPINDYLELSADYGARRSYNGGPYRSYHEGTDFSAYAGTPVTAPAAGTVVLAEPLAVRGGAVIVDHGLGIYTGYYHLSSVIATPGQVVAPGDLLGEVGTTGLSTGNHLHWDLIVNGTWVDAMRWLEQDTACWLSAALGAPCAVPNADAG